MGLHESYKRLSKLPSNCIDIHLVQLYFFSVVI